MGKSSKCNLREGETLAEVCNDNMIMYYESFSVFHLPLSSL